MKERVLALRIHQPPCNCRHCKEMEALAEMRLIDPEALIALVRQGLDNLAMSSKLEIFPCTCLTPFDTSPGHHHSLNCKRRVEVS